MKISVLLLLVTLSIQNVFANDMENQFKGTFIQPCQTIDTDTIQQSLIFSDNSSPNSLTWTISAFEDEKCQKPYLKIRRKFDIVGISSQSATVTTTQVSYTAITDEVAESLNFINYCGYTDWAAGQIKDVTGRICDDYQQLKNNEYKQYSLVRSNNKLNWDNDLTPYIESQLSKIVTGW